MTTLSLQPDAVQTAALLRLHEQLRGELERDHFPRPATIGALKTALSEALDRQPGFAALWDAARLRPQTLCLVHESADIRNLPWQLAGLDRPLLAFAKSHDPALPAHAPAQGYPLKVLVMVAAPEGVTALDHESEELRLLQALSPLMARGLAQVHFTDDGSLENLEAKLCENHYHILHFSGHGAFRKGKGTLALEDEATGHRKDADAVAFNAVLAKAARLKRRPELVLLSACQTAQGDRSGELGGLADTLLAAGQTAVVAMSASILDQFATEFEAALYEQLALGEPLPAAFQAAVQELFNFESRHDLKGRAPGQYLIPQLLLAAAAEQLVDHDKPRTELDFQDVQYVAGRSALLQLRRRDKHYVFIGRRRERREALAKLTQGDAVLLLGQGGVGKTALAEHLAVRLLAADQRRKVFVHSEKEPVFQTLIEQICRYLSRDKNQTAIADEIKAEGRDSAGKQFRYLLQRLGEYCSPVFIFDNIESYQLPQDHGWVWDAEKHGDLLEGIRFLQESTRFPLLLTGRYRIAELPELFSRDLNTVPFTDFFKKCLQLPLRSLAQRLENAGASAAPPPQSKGDAPDSPLRFEDLARRLHKAFGGHYRALEFFDEIYAKRPDEIFTTLSRIETERDEVARSLRDPRDPDGVLARLGANLVFHELLALVAPGDSAVLSLLACFRIPVLPMALGMQSGQRDCTDALDRLTGLTLAERSRDAAGRPWYYVTPLVKDLLTEAGLPEPAFSALPAAEYHDTVIREKLSPDPLSDHVEAFEWYEAARALEGVNRIGFALCNYYHDVQQYRTALRYGRRTELIADEATDGRIWNILGMILLVFGDLEPALHYFEKRLPLLQAAGDRQGEGTILNNISQIHDAKGDYDTALRYIEQSLRIRQEIGDRKGEGTTLNNLAATAHAKGDYDTALRYLEQSLRIQQEIGDRKGEGGTLNNISQIHDAKGDYDTALRYLEQSLRIQQEIGDRQGEGTTLNNISQIHNAKGDYDTALRYLEQSLRITQEIGDRRGAGVTLHNMAKIAKQQEDYNRFWDYENQAFKIAQEIGYKNDIYDFSYEIGLFLCQIGQLEQGLGLLQQCIELGRQLEAPDLEIVEQAHAHFVSDYEKSKP